MKTLTLTLPLLAITGLVLAGCPADDAPMGETESTSDEPSTSTGPTTNPPTTTTDPDTTMGSMDTTATATATETGSTTEPDPGPFVFEEAPPEDYTQVDRKGFPAINTGLNLLGDKDVYNAASPADDAALMFETNILESLETLHLGAPGAQTPDNTGLDDDMIGLGLEPCVTPPLMGDNCDNQAGPFAVPDVLRLDLDEDPVFPNGRTLDFPVMDVIFAVLLLDLGTHDVTTFLDLDGDGTFGPSLNPLANDAEFSPGFPYLAPANQ